MFRRVIFQHILTCYWFGVKDNDRAFYFKDKTQVELVTLALIIVAVQYAIEEWSTGRWVTKEFSHLDYFKLQVKEKGAPFNATIQAQQELLRTARAAMNKPQETVEQEEEEDLFSLDAMFALASDADGSPT
ncbi:hypothetical protein DFH09DRAFT_1309289 [Mycena vulgaris]|nr:hypothetical protein DFH09DRAFT_1309289 [Mycena vulgaris]